MSEDLRYEVRDGIAWLTFHRPQARNALTFAMYDELRDRALAVNDDAAIKAVVLTGSGGAFVAGTDIAQFRMFKSEQDPIAYERRMDETCGALEAVRVPTIAAIGGATTGGGLAIAAACDLRIASTSAAFGMPIARTLGNALSMANLARLSDLIGAGRVKDLMFTTRIVGADEAKAIGLVSEITADDALEARAQELATMVAGFAPRTLWATKEALRRLRARDLPDGTDLLLHAYLSDDFKEGIEAFLAKRPPRWTGS
ncbi:MAG: enoyl-CoA hydratase/isomerase family protein [Chloroflexi bacterium]|nr:enoyl-CoA hydratase/isomerase family protein [Chloroflexota bacterium]